MTTSSPATAPHPDAKGTEPLGGGNVMSAPATYTHLRDGSWGIRLVGTASAGKTVTVQKKDGSTKQETVSRVLWIGRDSKTGQTISLCAIGNGSSNGHSTGHSTRRTERCEGCGYSGGRHRDGCEDAHGGMSYYDSHGNYVLGSDD